MSPRTNRWLQFLGVLMAGTCWSVSAPAQAQKSAQSECSREAQRRGYQVVSTRNVLHLKHGWSMDIRVRDARGRELSGTCFVEAGSGDVSLYGFGWSGGGSSNDFEFSCASSDERYRECELPVSGRARLVKQRSDAPCIEGRSWGQRGDRVWVDRGCRARFTVEPKGGGWGGGQGQVQQRAQAACRSEAQRHDMYVQDVGTAEWNQSGRYWMTTVRGTYQGRRATAGCRWYPDRQRTEMNFGQGWVSGGGGWSGGGGASQAERGCLNEAQRQGYSVIQHDSPYPTQSGYGMFLKVKRAGGPAVEGYCRYLRSSGRAQLDVFGPGRSAKGDPEVR